MLKGMTLFICYHKGGDLLMEHEDALQKILEQEQQLKEMNDYCTSLKVENEAFQSKINEQNDKINHLKQINMRYFERLTMETKQIQEAKPDDSISKEPVKDWDSFLSEW